MAFFEDLLNGLTQPPAAPPRFGTLAVKPPQPAPAAPAQSRAVEPTSGWDDMATFFAGMGDGNGALLPALGAGARAVSAESKRREAVNQTYDFLLRNGVSAEDAKATISNPDLLKMKLGQIFAPKTMAVNPGQVIIGADGKPIFDNRETVKPTGDIVEYEYAKKQGFNGTLNDFLLQKGAGANQPPSGYTRNPDGTMSFVPGGPADPATIQAQTLSRGRGRQFAPSDIAKLTDEGVKYANANTFVDTFNDGYAGYGMQGLGEAAMTMGRMGIPLPGAASTDAAKWWQRYSRYKNEIRNDLFGSALTATEKAAFEQADINPGMDPKVIRNNLAIQKQAMASAMSKKGKALAAAKYDPEVISQAYGVPMEELTQAAQGGGQPAQNDVSKLSDEELLKRLGGR